MSVSFDPSVYHRPPVISTASGFTLGCALITAMPKKSPDMVRRTAEILRADTMALQASWIAKDKEFKAEFRRKTDTWADNAWGALHGRIESYRRLPGAKYPLVGRAEEILALLFSEGLSFVLLPYDEQWAESEKRMKKIEMNALEKDIEAIAGSEFLENLREAHEAYGKLTGTTEPKAPVTKVTVGDPLRKVQVAIGRYARQWAALAEDSPDLLEMATMALAPIDRLREKQASSRVVVEEGEVDPSQPVPDLPTE